MSQRIVLTALLAAALLVLPSSSASAGKFYWLNKKMEKYVIMRAKATEGYELHTNRNAGRPVTCEWKGGYKRVYKKGKFKGNAYNNFECTFALIPLDAVPSGGYVDCIYLTVRAIPQSSRYAELTNINQYDYTCALAS